jgi:hypothetical protein
MKIALSPATTAGQKHFAGAPGMLTDSASVLSVGTPWARRGTAARLAAPAVGAGGCGRRAHLTFRLGARAVIAMKMIYVHPLPVRISTGPTPSASCC